MNPPGVGGDISACIPYAGRDQFSLDFFLCEQGNGWPGLHFANAITTYMFFPNFILAGFIVFITELLEWSSYVLIGRPLGFNFENELDLETVAGSWVADVLIQGGSGLIVGYFIHIIWDSPPLVPLKDFWAPQEDSLKRGYKFLIRNGVQYKTIPTIRMIVVTTIIFALHKLLGVLHFIVGETLNIGAIIFIGTRAIFLAIFLIATGLPGWDSAIWGPEFPPSRRIKFVLFFWLVESLVNVHNIGFLYIGNNQWIQTWTWQGIEIIVLGLMALVFYSNRKQKSMYRF